MTVYKKAVCNVYAIGLIFYLLFVSSNVWPQRIPKSLWIIFDPADSLCVKMVGNSFRFYKVDKKFPYWDLGAAADANIKCDTIHKLPRNRHIVTRKELFVLLDKYPGRLASMSNPSPESMDDWYNRLYPITFVLVKEGRYYLCYHVVKVDIFD